MLANDGRPSLRHVWLWSGIAALLVVLGVIGVVGAESYRRHRADGPMLQVVVARSIDRVAHAVVPPGVR